MNAHNNKPGWYQWLNERYQIDDLMTFIRHKKVPVHGESVWYYFGGVSMFLFIIQVISGILLLIYYRSGEAEAYESVKFLVTDVRFGWLIRSIHSWSANLLILAIFIHMFSVYFTRAYQKPREFTWVTGMVLLLIMFGFGFSGYLLPWNELAFFATKVGTDIIAAVPLIGKPLQILMRGSENVTGATLSRFFGLHVAILPAMATVILGLHLIMVQVQGMSEPEHFQNQEEEKKRYMPFFPNFILRDMLLWLIVLNVLAILAVFFPWEIGKKADLFASAPAGIRPEWYFMFMFQTLKLLPSHIGPMEGEIVGIVGFGLAGLLWIMIPFLNPTGAGKRGRLFIYLGIGAIAFILIMTIWGYLAE